MTREVILTPIFVNSQIKVVKLFNIFFVVFLRKCKYLLRLNGTDVSY